MMKDDALERLALAIQARDEEFSRTYCHSGQYTGTDGKQIGAVTCSVDASEYVAFMHKHDQGIIRIIDEIYAGQSSNSTKS